LIVDVSALSKALNCSFNAANGGHKPAGRMQSGAS